MFRYELRPREHGTEIVLTGEVGGLSGIMRLVGTLFAGSYRKACAKDPAALKAHLETTRTTAH